MSNDTHKTEFSNVDRARDPQWYVNCLAGQDAIAGVERYKRRAVDLLGIQSGQTILDAGCGIGTYSAYAAQSLNEQGRIVGLDSSATMIAEAQRRVDSSSAVVCVQGDVYLLEFANAEFNGCFSINTFQHLVDPLLALAELMRVTKPGGRIVIADPDHELVVIDTPYPDIDRKFLNFRSDSLKQGGGAHRLYGMFKRAGLVNVSVEVWPTVYTDYEQRKVAAPFIDEIWIAQKAGVVTTEEATTWSNWLKDTVAANSFFSVMVNIITIGEKST